MSSNLRTVRAALRRLRNLPGGEDFTVLQVLFLLEVALREGSTISDMADRLEVVQSTATRAVDVLGSFGRGQRPGAGLVERREDPDDRRVKYLHLTPEGRKLVANL